MTETWAGGCQCGAVRYRFTRKPRSAHLCHCRMCQKAFGAFYAPLVGSEMENFVVTRGVLAIFRSSDLVERGFCHECGTPLSFAHVGGHWMSVSIGSLDNPEAFPPKDQHGANSRIHWVSDLGQLPDVAPIEERAPERAAAIALTNHQHPDHDTATWPQK
ncbi:GFA family protein [Devosia sp.]|uniref:GFA family protein n=1 Tax=Devosia sp. TaxID=1871048 RepID=UPI001ACC600D|nr:GFA family protein [Devosia sp.]MBN9332375.1 GFA family protein [Devosia sp.]